MGNNKSNTVGENQSGEATSSITPPTIAGKSSNNELRPEIFKLNVDCFELVFEWLSLRELLVFRRTCKRMKAVVDYYIKLNYPRLTHNKGNLMDFSPVRLGCFEWIKHLELSNSLTDTQIGRIEYVLNQLESLKLDDIKIDGDLYETLLKYCPRLKYLKVQTYIQTFTGTGNAWLERQYSTLEHIEISYSVPIPMIHLMPQPLPCSELLTFFQLNPNVRILSINCTLFLINCNLFLASDVKLDRLRIIIGSKDKLNTICNLTNRLYEQRFYKQLHLKVWSQDDDNDLRHLWSFCNLKKLSCLWQRSDLVPPVVECIKEVSFHSFPPPHKTPMFMGMHLINLKRVSIQIACLHNIQLFVAYAPKLAQIKVYEKFYRFNPLVEMFMSVEPNIEDFIQLNEKRKNLPGACKMVIYVQEKLFLKLKWSGTVKFSLIELKRVDSCNIELIPVDDWNIFP